MSNSDCMTYLTFSVDALDALTAGQRSSFFGGINGVDGEQRLTVAGDNMMCKYCTEEGTPPHLDLLGASTFDYAGILAELDKAEWVYPDPVN